MTSVQAWSVDASAGLLHHHEIPPVDLIADEEGFSDFPKKDAAAHGIGYRTPSEIRGAPNLHSSSWRHHADF